MKNVQTIDISTSNLLAVYKNAVVFCEVIIILQSLNRWNYLFDCIW